MRRAIPAVSALAFVFLSGSVAPARAQSAPPSAAEKARKEKEKEKDKKPPKVYTNDDLEETSTRPSKVQDATAQGAQPYTPPPEVQGPDTSSEAPAPPAREQMSEREMRLKEAEDNVKGLEQNANALLWQYLQSGDTNEILRLKAEQQGVLEQLEQAKAELARIKAEEGRPTPPTPPPG